MILSPALSQSGQSHSNESKSSFLSPPVIQSRQLNDSVPKSSILTSATSQGKQKRDSVSNHGVGGLSSLISKSRQSNNSVSRHSIPSPKISNSDEKKDPISKDNVMSPASSQSNDSFSKDSVRKTAASIISSVIRHMSQFVENRENEELLNKLPEAQQNVYSFPYAKATESLANAAREFVNSLINEAFKKVKEKHDEEIEEMKAKMYPQTKNAKDSFPSVFEMCNFFVHTILSEAIRRVDQIKLIGVERFAKYNSVEDFKMKDGLEIVARCISAWSFNPHWYFKIIYNGRSVSDTYSYYYTVRWSAPSLCYPIAQVAADVYFLIEVFPMTPPPVFIQVCYRLETDRSNRCALKTPFLEKWLHTVIRRKLEAFQMFKF